MWQNPRDAYLENRILSASPLGLIRLLYQGAASAVRDARRHLAAGEIRARARAISKACGILVELAASLDHTRGGDLSRRLAALYVYMHRRLNEANLQQSDAPLTEVLGLLATLSEAWETLNAQETGARAVAATSTPWAQSAETAVCSQGWSL
jgi:flagellar secretion chaperone FliS